MYEARAARSEDIDGLVGLLCEAFDLPFEPAREIVLGDPYFDLTRKRVLADSAGCVVACLTVTDQVMWIGRARVPVAGIAGVTTRLDVRGQGLAGALLRDTLAFLRGEGYGLTALLAPDPRCYRRLGWEHAGLHAHLIAPARHLPRRGEPRRVRLATPADIPAMSALYDAASREVTGSCIRDARRWDYLWRLQHDRFVACFDEVEGYALCEQREQEAGDLTVAEIVAATERARAALVSQLAGMARGGKVHYTGARRVAEDSGLAVRCATIVEEPGPMFRVVDLARALHDLRDNVAGWTGRLVCRMVDGDAAQAAVIRGDGNDVTVSPSDPDAPVDLDGAVAAWSALLPGGIGLEEAIGSGAIACGNPDAARAAAPLFPPRNLAVPVPDYF